MDMKVKSVKKKWKDKSFAAGVNRDVIAKGAEMLGVELDELIEDVIMGMREAGRPGRRPGQDPTRRWRAAPDQTRLRRADEIGLKGNCSS